MNGKPSGMLCLLLQPIPSTAFEHSCPLYLNLASIHLSHRLSKTMQPNIPPNLDMPAPPMSLSHAIDLASMTFLHTGQTQAQVNQILYKLIYVPETADHRTWLLISQFECLLSLVAALLIIIKKQSFGKLWLVSRKDSSFGSIYVTNAILCLILGVASYLLAWTVMSIVIAAFSFSNLSSNGSSRYSTSPCLSFARPPSVVYPFLSSPTHFLVSCTRAISAVPFARL